MIKRILIGGLGLIALLAALIWWQADRLKLKAVGMIGEAAETQMAENPDAVGTTAAEFINIPIVAREIATNVWQVTGVGNIQMVRTSKGDVIYDTGLALQTAKQLAALNAAVPDLNITHIILSHAHADHTGGEKFMPQSAERIAHAAFPEAQRYLTELDGYFWDRNRTLFPFMPEDPPKIGLIAYGGVDPDRLVAPGNPLVLDLGGTTIELHALSGAEGDDNLVAWLPEQRVLLSGDFFGPIFPQFPNVFTMRGEKIREPIPYVQSLDHIMALDPLMIVPSHRNPVTDKAVIDDGLRRMRGATFHVHEAVMEGMRSGKTLEELMVEVSIPEEFALTEAHGKVSWAVKSIWEYYATWFHFDDTTELYALPRSRVDGDILAAAGEDALLDRAENRLAADEPLHALHLVNIVMNAQPSERARDVKVEALQALLAEAMKTGNDYELYWLRSRIDATQALNFGMSVSNDE